VYSVTLFCSDPACDAVFEAEGSLDAVAAAICPFCGCMLGEMSCIPCGGEAEEESQLLDLELWVIHEPAGRRLRRRRRAKSRLPKAA
jgi:hypothetical protein